MKRLVEIRKEVESCWECPFYTVEKDMNASIPCCSKGKMFLPFGPFEMTAPPIPEICPLPRVMG